MGSVNGQGNSSKDLITIGGAYSLLIFLPKAKEIAVGMLGSFYFPAGFYIYTGSALRGLTARIVRHLRKNKTMHWHIDYLTCLDSARVEEVLFYDSKNNIECKINQGIMTWKGAKIVVPGFGSSDCTQGCKSHLVYFETRPKMESLNVVFGATV